LVKVNPEYLALTSCVAHNGGTRGDKHDAMNGHRKIVGQIIWICKIPNYLDYLDSHNPYNKERRHPELKPPQ
jgi:hypothetical protein